MDATHRRIVDTLIKLQQEIMQLNRKANAIKETLQIIDLRPNYEDEIFQTKDEEYAEEQPFASLTLVETCRRVLIDHEGKSLTKSQVEYLASMGGYKFSAEDPRNSVSITLQRLADDGFCLVDAKMGPKGNSYMWTRVTEKRE